MRKHTVCLALAFALVLALSSTGSAGLCIQLDSYEDAYYFEFAPVGPGLFSLDGYEYGMPYSPPFVLTGSMYLTGGSVFISVAGHWGDLSSSDYGLPWTQYIVINLGTMTGSIVIQTMPMEAGVLAPFGNLDTCAASVCTPTATSGAAGSGPSFLLGP